MEKMELNEAGTCGQIRFRVNAEDSLEDEGLEEVLRLVSGLKALVLICGRKVGEVLVLISGGEVDEDLVLISGREAEVEEVHEQQH